MTSPLKLQQIVKLLDVTRLQDQDSAEAQANWLHEQLDARAVPAAFCVYPQYVSQSKSILQQQGIHSLVATVVNFPSGNDPVDAVCDQIHAAIAAGADEIDCVLPYQALLAGDIGFVKNFLYEVRQACGTTCLKIIIESGELSTTQQISKATELVVACGADFVKTSTGKVPVGATLDAARMILTVIAAADRPVGFKASGGVRQVAEANEYVALYEEITGELANPSFMRIGASTLYSDVKALLVG